MLSVITAGQSFGFRGNNKIYILEYHAGSYMVDAADVREQGIQYNNVQFEVLDQDEFDTTVSVAKVNGCIRETAQFHMRCTSQKVVF